MCGEFRTLPALFLKIIFNFSFGRSANFQPHLLTLGNGDNSQFPFDYSTNYDVGIMHEVRGLRGT